MIAGQSGGTWDAPVQSRAVRLVRERQGLAKTWGCDAPEGAYQWSADRPPRLGEPPESYAKKITPCLTFKTQGDQLTEAGIDWAYYSAADFQVGYIWNAYAAFDRILNTDLWDKHIRPVDRLVQDIQDQRLPSVTWVTPRYELSDHPPWSVCYGHNWVTSIVNAVMRSPMWRHTAIFITWDEWGGFYDHVPPPNLDAFGLGIRVPLLIVSPYAKRGLVDHEQGEFSSPQKFIADNWGLSYLTDRVRRTTNYEHVFDFRARPRDPDPRPPNRHCIGTRFKAKWDIEEWKKLPGFDGINLSQFT
jgi:phospholipase C